MVTTADVLDRSPPQNLAAEIGLLGAVLVDPSRLDVARSAVTRQDFYDDAHGALFDSLVVLHDAGKPIGDMAVLSSELRRLDVMDRVGGVAAIGKLATNGIASNASYYASEVRRCSLLRRQLLAATELLSRAHESKADPATIARWLDGQLSTMSGEQAAKSRLIGEVIVDLFSEIGERRVTERGVWSGLSSIDSTMGAIMPGELLTVAAQPGHGKSAFATQVALHNAERGRRCQFVSLEMSESELTQRVVCGYAGVDSRRVRSAALTSTERARLIDAGNQTLDMPLHIWAPSHATVGDIRGTARLQARAEGLDLLVIDYLGFIQPSDPSRRRNEQVAHDCHAIKALAKELEVPILVLCQLSRESARVGKDGQPAPPSLQHLAESAAVERDSDVVLMLHRVDATRTQAIVAKHRHSATGTVELGWVGSETRFVDLT